MNYHIKLIKTKFTVTFHFITCMLKAAKSATTVNFILPNKPCVATDGALLLSVDAFTPVADMVEVCAVGAMLAVNELCPIVKPAVVSVTVVGSASVSVDSSMV